VALWYLREETDADSMAIAAMRLVRLLLPVLYSCTPGQPPKCAP